MQHATKTAAKKNTQTPTRKSTPPPAKGAKTAAERKADRVANAKTQPMLAVVRPEDLEQGQALDSDTMSDQPGAIRIRGTR